MSIFNKYALEFEQKYMDVSAYSVALDFLCSKIEDKNAKILDAACGPGNICKYLLTKIPSLKVLGIDLAPKMIQLARKNNPTAEFELLDCRSIKKLKTKFDIIIFSFGTPYLSPDEVIQFIKDASTLLKTNGYLYLSTMEGDQSKSGYYSSSSGVKEQLFINYYTEKFILNHFINNNFKIELKDKNKLVGPNNEEIIDLFVIGARG